MKRRREHAADQAADLPCGTTAETAPTTDMPAADVVAVDPEDLLAVEDDDDPARQAAESLQRRLGDLELRDQLTGAEFRGPVWERFANELARYGHAVMMAWLWTGEIFVQCQARNCSPGPGPPSWTYDDRMSLANDTVAHAIGKFRDRALIAGKWSVTGGASLKTYFIGACVYAFPNFYRKWCTEQQRHRRLHQDGLPLTLMVPTESDDPAALVLDAIRLWSQFDHLPDEKIKTAILLEAMGYTHDEIGELLHKTSGAVKEMLRRQRQRGARTADEGGSDG
jgi:DNA-directed RNA polymerase specialized sigma24 family protein